ncbi:MAG: TPMT family class I SAM-dependent methyltransferase [Gammaproteobacteria bacterium SHHR-1]
MMKSEYPIDPQRQTQWEQRYRQGSTGWDQGGPSTALDHWLESMPPGRVLVPGCGHGHEIGLLAQAGHEVTAVDIAPTPLARLRQALAESGLQAEVVQADLLHWEPAGRFDFIYEQTCLCALAPEHWADYAQRLHRWLRPGGRLYALFMQTGQEVGPPFHCDLGQMRRLFAGPAWRWPTAEALELHRANGNCELGYALEAV